MLELSADSLAFLYQVICPSMIILKSFNILCSCIGAITTVPLNTGHDTGDILLDNVGCIGNENRLIDCPRGSLVNPLCTHSRDARVRCQTRTGTT